MGRDVSLAIEVTGELVCCGPVHVGDWDAGPGNRLPVQRDGQHQLLIPGTSIAGALRSWLSRASTSTGPFDVRRLFGHIVPGTEDGEASLIQVDDAVAEAVLQHRDGVAIDRHTGAAAGGFLYEREVVPAGTRFSFRLTAHEPRAGSARVDEAVDCLVAALAAGRIAFGARRSTGHGRAKLENPWVRKGDQSTRGGMAAWLRREPAASASAPAVDASDGNLEITVEWAARTPVLVQDSVQGTVVDALPLTGRVVDDSGHARLAWLLPGSSVKGALRSHAERIVRTLRDIAAPGEFLDVLRDPRLGPVLTLFGFASNRSVPAADDKRPSGWRGALDVTDCHSRTAFDDDAWQQVLTAHSDGGDPVEDLAVLRARLAGLPAAARPRISHHVAIDRWTGGAAENLLFSVLEPADVEWENLTLVLDTQRCRDDPLALPLLLLLLRDLNDGWLQLGFGGTRGRGTVTGSKISFAGSGLAPPWTALGGRTLQDIIAHPPDEVEQAFAAWRSSTEAVQAVDIPATVEIAP
jgi:CRISPR/Cas system CSM-associated protein Csm3 (group 7 of RAMP superfamily)